MGLKKKKTTQPAGFVRDIRNLSDDFQSDFIVEATYFQNELHGICRTVIRTSIRLSVYIEGEEVASITKSPLNGEKVV